MKFAILKSTILLSICFRFTLSEKPNNVNHSTITLGFLGASLLPSTNALAGGQAALFAFKMAINDINNSSDLLPNTKLNYVWNETLSDPGLASVATFDQCVHQNVIGIVGEMNSVVSEVSFSS